MFPAKTAPNPTARPKLCRGSSMRNLNLLMLMMFWVPVGVSIAAAPGPRRPVALAWSSRDGLLFTANRDSSSLTVIDGESHQVLKEVRIGGQPSDVQSLDDGRLLVLDRQQHQIKVVTRTGEAWQVTSEHSVAPHPVCIVLDRDRQQCYVASLWSRTVSVFGIPPDSGPVPLEVVELPFEPRVLCLTPGGSSLIAAGAFEARLAALSTDPYELVATHEIPGHNIAGLAVDPTGDNLLVTQQELNPLAHSTRDDIHWGNMISNIMSTYPLTQVCDGGVSLNRHRVVTQLGEPGNGAADPGAITLDAIGNMAILLGGRHEVLVHKPGTISSRIRVGRRPIASELDADRKKLFVANMFSDSVSVVDLTAGREELRIALGELAEPSAVDRGEALFFDGELSHDGWMSCHSCHTEGHSNGQLNDNLSDGGFGAPKRVLSVLGVADTAPWGWNGSITSLETQVLNSITMTMRGPQAEDGQVGDIVAFLKTLPPPPQLAPSDARSLRGRQVFTDLGCANCHEPPTYTSTKSYDVNMKDAQGNRHFNPPSLRGVARRGSLFHDGRCASTSEAFITHRHQVEQNLSDDDVAALVRFLSTLGPALVN